MDNDDINKEEFAVEEHQIEREEKKTRPKKLINWKKIKITDKNSNYD